MSEALYRKYRSRTLAELVGQEHITTVLRRSLEKGHISHAYLLTGPRGSGKTSIARILAHEINGIEYTDDSTDLDIIEIDAASNRRIDDIRELRERVHVAPSRSKYKVYIIDEVHMLTGESFNALLKTLEEPPAHVVFILATTEIDKLPATILSRTQTFHFRKIPAEIMTPHLRGIADQESISIDNAALDVIAHHAQGSLRDAESALDQVRHTSATTITAKDVETALGSISGEAVDGLLASLRSRDTSAVAFTLKELENEGISPVVLSRELSVRLVTDTVDYESLGLLDALLEVPKSYSPSMKLFSVLIRFTTPKKAVALYAPVSVIKQPVETAAPRSSQPLGLKTTVQTPDTKKGKATLVLPAVQVKSEPFDWDALIALVKEKFIVLHSVLHKCSYNYDGSTLTVYSKFKLHKMKLDDPKYNTMLNEALISLTGSAPTISIVFGSKPITDGGLADIAAIMGGGEEIHV